MSERVPTNAEVVGIILGGLFTFAVLWHIFPSWTLVQTAVVALFVTSAHS